MRFGGAYVLWEDPLILGCQGEKELSEVLALRTPATVLFWPAWMWTLRNVPELAKFRWQAWRQGKSLHFMCNSPREDRMLRGFGFPGRLVSINSYIDENLFRITGEAKEYDAVYTAQMTAFKRIALAAQIPSLYVITYGDCKTPQGENDLHRFEPAIAHADFNRGWATFDQIVSILNRSRVGLSLSAREGAMLASVEYMLCGLPQVSTPCEGGRELFFDDRYVRVVPPDAAAVAGAVRELIEKNIDPQLVRDGTLERIRQHREALSTYVQTLIRQAKARVPEMERVYEGFFGGAGGTISRFVLRKDFDAHGLR